MRTIALALAITASFHVSQPKADELSADAIVAITRVFDSRYALGFGTRRELIAKPAPNGAIIVENTPYVLHHSADDACDYQMESNGNFYAEIRFDRLSAEYATAGGRLVVYGVDGAVCDYSGIRGRVTCFDNYLTYPTNSVPDVLRALRYIFANLCRPVELPVQ
jgi:hypothetical protein